MTPRWLFLNSSDVFLNSCQSNQYRTEATPLFNSLKNILSNLRGCVFSFRLSACHIKTNSNPETNPESGNEESEAKWQTRRWVAKGLAYGVATLAEFTQKVPRNWIKFWALSGLFTQQKVPRILKKCKQTRQGPEFERLPGHFLG